MFEFFRLWLLVVSAGIALGSTTLVLIVGTPIFSRVGWLLDRPFWRSEPDAATRRFQTWSYSVTFATIAGWGLMMAVLVANAYASRQAWVWWSVAGGVALWFGLDTARSLHARAYANVTLNVAILVAVAIPLVATFGEFH